MVPFVVASRPNLVCDCFQAGRAVQRLISTNWQTPSYSKCWSSLKSVLDSLTPWLWGQTCKACNISTTWAVVAVVGSVSDIWTFCLSPVDCFLGWFINFSHHLSFFLPLKTVSPCRYFDSTGLMLIVDLWFFYSDDDISSGCEYIYRRKLSWPTALLKRVNTPGPLFSPIHISFKISTSIGLLHLAPAQCYKEGFRDLPR